MAAAEIGTQMDLLEIVIGFLIEFMPDALANLLAPHEPAPALSNVRLQTLFGSDGWWNQQ
jgi:hypothetical protein